MELQLSTPPPSTTPRTPKSKSDSQLNTPPCSNTTTPTTETAPSLPLLCPAFDCPDMDPKFLQLGLESEWDFVNDAMVGDSVVEKDESSSQTSSYLSSCSHQQLFVRQHEQDSPEGGPKECPLRRMCPNSPDFKRKRRQETWPEISARILCHTEAFFLNWRPVVAAMNLKKYPADEMKLATFDHDDEFEEFFRRVLEAWAYEHHAAASAANLVGFLYVCGFGILADKVREEIAAATAATVKNRSWMQAQRTTHLFTGRQSVFLQLHQIVMDAHKPGSISRIPMTVISGLGGMGKTELVRFYARSFSDYFDRNVLWISADDKMKMRQSFLKLAADLEIEVGATISDTELAARCYAYFSTGCKCKSLFIFDNAESYKGEADGVAEFLPTAGGGLLEESTLDKAPYVILTSRAGGVEEWPANEFKTLALEAWQPTESVTFLEQAMPGGGGPPTVYERLAEELGHYPLALQQAVGFITSSSHNSFRSLQQRITSFLELFHSHAHLEELLDFKQGTGSGGSYQYQYQCTVYTILTMALSKIGDLARELLIHLAFMGPDKIPIHWLINSENETSIAMGVDELSRFSLITVTNSLGTSDEGAQLQVHRLVQKLVRQKTESPIQQLTAVLRILAPRIHTVYTTIKHYTTTSLSEEQKLCVRHSSIFCNHILTAQPPSLGNLDLSDLHPFVCNVWNSLIALDHYREALAVAQGFSKLYIASGIGSNFCPVLELGIMAGRTYLRLNVCRDALEQFLNVRNDAPEGSSLYLSATFHLGWTYNRLARWDEARECYEDCLAVASAATGIGANSEAVRYKLYALSGIGNVERCQYDHLEAALAQFEAILDTPNWEQVLDDDERIQFIYQLTGLVLKRLGRHSEAVKILQQNVGRLEPKYGPHASLTLTAKINLIDSLLDDGKVAEAHRVTKDIYNSARSKLGDINLTFFVLEEHRLKIRELQAEADGVDRQTFVKVLDEVHDAHMAILTAKMDKMRLGLGHVSVIHTHKRLCEVEAAKGDWVAAKERAELVLEKQLQVPGWGPDHGDVKWTQGFLEEVEAQLRELNLNGGVNLAGLPNFDQDPRPPPQPMGGNGGEGLEMDDGNPFPCPHCHFVASRSGRRRSIKRHLEEQHSVLGYLPGRELPIHGPVQKFPCERCGREMHRDYKLRDHMLTCSQ